MSWLRLDDRFTKHPKFEGWTVTQKWAWLEVMEYCARYSTEGRIPTDLSLLPRTTTPALLARAEAAKWVERASDGALWINDWDLYNPPRSTVEELVAEYLTAHPQATANEVAREVKGSRKKILSAVARFRSGSPGGSESGTESGTESVPNRDESGYARAGAGAPASPSRPLPSKEPLSHSDTEPQDAWDDDLPPEDAKRLAAMWAEGLTD